MADKDDSQQDLPPGPQWTEGQITFMKRAIAVMTVILFVGFAALIGRILQMSKEDAPSKVAARPGVSDEIPRAPTAPAPATPAPSLKARARLALPAGSKVQNLSLSGRYLAVQYASPGGSGIVIIDLTSGKSASQIDLVAGSGSQ